MRRSCSLLVTAAAEIVDAGEIRNGRVFRSLLRPVILARLIGDSDQGLGVLMVALEELHEFRRRSWRRQHGLLLEILDEFRLPIERHELGIEPVHDRLRHSAWGGQSPPAEGRKVDARPPQWRATDASRVGLLRKRRTSRTPSFELIGDLLDAGLDAGFILVAAGSAGNAGRTDYPSPTMIGSAPRAVVKPVRYCAPICGFFFSRSSISPEGIRNVRAVKAFLKLFSMVCGPVPSPRIWTSTSPLRPTTVADTR